jgi:uncharacterized membrane protein
MTSLFSGIPNQNSANNPYTVGQTCPSGGGKTATDAYGDGCLASEAVLYQPWAIVFDSAGNAYIADTNAGSYSYVRKVDATTGIITLFAGGLSGVVASPGPCGSYNDGNGHSAADPAVTGLSYASSTAGDGCPAEDPVTLAPYSYFKGIRDLAIDATYLYIADSSNSKIRKISLSSSPLQYRYYAHELEPVAGEGGSGWSQDGAPTTVQIKNPYAVTVDTAGNVFFADQSGDSIRRVTPTTYSLVGSVITPTLGAVLTIGNCAASGSTCSVQTNGDVCPTATPGAGASRNMRFYNITGLAFDSSGNLFVSVSKCYSVYKIANNGSNPIDGSTGMTTLMGNGATGSYAGGGWMPAYSGGAQSSTRGVTSAGGSNLYIINGTNAWFYDATDTANGATNGWIHEIWNSASPVGTGCTGSVGTPTPTSYFGCPAPYASFAAGSQGGHGSVDANGNLYVADGNDALVLKAANGLDFVGTAPQVVASAPLTQTALIHGADLAPTASGVTTVAQTNFTLASPFALAMDVDYPAAAPTSACTQYNNNTNPTDDAQDCTLSVTYTPSATGLQTGTLGANGASLPVDGYGANAAPPSLTASVSCNDKVYDTTTATNGCVCSLAPSELNVSCGATMTCTFASSNVGSAIVETCTGITLGGSAASGYTLSNSSATTANNITVASPALSATCAGGVYNGTAYSCAGTATGVGGATVAGSFAFVPGSETNAGSYPETGTFTSSDPNYASGGTASATLTITQMSPTLTVVCPEVTYDGNAHSCVGSATGVGGVTVAGSFAFSPGSETAAGSYPETGTFTSSDPNYASGGTATGTLIIDPATPVLAISCPSVTFDGSAHSCTATATGVSGAGTAQKSQLHMLIQLVQGAAVNGSFACVPASETNVGTYPVTCTFTSTDPDYVSGGTVSGSLVINAAIPVLSATCVGGVYTGTAYSCTGTATGVGGAAVAGSFAFAPGSEINAGSYPETGTFTSTNSNYLSGGTANATLIITAATPATTLTCPEVTYDGTLHGCTCSTTGVGGATVAGTCNYTPGPESNVGSYLETAAFTSSNPNYSNGAGATATLKIDAASPTLTLTCNTVTANGNPQACAPGGSATGVGGAVVAGTWTYTYNGSSTVPSAAASYTVVTTFTSTNSNYVSGGTATGPFVISSEPVVAVTLSCPAATYNGSAQGCTATPTPLGATCTGLIAETNAGSYPESVTCSDAGYQPGTATGTLVINAATPILAATCAGGVYTGTAYSCTGTATGVGGAAVAGTFAFAPGSETNAGAYLETGTFTSSNANYVSGGTAGATLLITTVTPTLTLTCNTVAGNGNPQACAPGGSATGIGGATVAGTFAYTYNGSATVPSAPATYAVVATFTSGNSNYASGGTASGSFVISSEPTVAVSLSCAAATYDGTAHGCTATPIPSTASCSGLVAETNAGSYPESVTCSNTGYQPGTGTGTLVINTATPVLSATCAGGVYNATAYSCTGSAAGVGGAAVAGSFAFAPGSETNAGSYPETGTFTSSNTNYASGGTASATLTITAVAPTITVICPTVTFDSNAHSCTATATGVGGATVSGTFAFVPGSETAAGSYPETATFTSTNANYTNGSGTGTLVINPPSAGTPALTLSAASVTFANPMMLGQASPAQYVQITSTGSASLQVSGVTIGGTNPGDFLVTNQAGTCTTGATLVYHADCNLRVVFAPTGVGARSAILYINDNASGSPQQVLVSGTAVTGAEYTISATTLTFASTTVGATAATQYITIKSTGYQPLVISQVVLSSGDFDLSDQAGTCTTAATTSLVPGADCNIRVKFHPTATGARTATVVINNNSATSPLTVTLNGTGE